MHILHILRPYLALTFSGQNPDAMHHDMMFNGGDVWSGFGQDIGGVSASEGQLGHECQCRGW